MSQNDQGGHQDSLWINLESFRDLLLLKPITGRKVHFGSRKLDLLLIILNFIHFENIAFLNLCLTQVRSTFSKKSKIWTIGQLGEIFFASTYPTIDLFLSKGHVWLQTPLLRLGSSGKHYYLSRLELVWNLRFRNEICKILVHTDAHIFFWLQNPFKKVACWYLCSVSSKGAIHILYCLKIGYSWAPHWDGQGCDGSQRPSNTMKTYKDE